MSRAGDCVATFAYFEKEMRKILDNADAYPDLNEEGEHQSKEEVREQMVDVVEMLEDGMTPTEISKQIGVKRPTLYRRFKKFNINLEDYT